MIIANVFLNLKTEIFISTTTKAFTENLCWETYCEVTTKPHKYIYSVQIMAYCRFGMGNRQVETTSYKLPFSISFHPLHTTVG